MRYFFSKIFRVILRPFGKLGRYVRFCYRFFVFRNECETTGRMFQMFWSQRRAFLYDDTTCTRFDRHYVYHPAWAARVLAQTLPKQHVDISSTLYFCSLVSAIIPVKYFDYRPAELILDNMSSELADLLELPFADDGIPSLSCMHVVEHVGLGRYGDSLDPDGDLKAIAELKRVLAPGGDLLFVVPVGGEPKVIFNAHRIYSYDQIMDYFSELELIEFALIPDKQEHGDLIRNAARELADLQEYGCGCFHFRKRPL